MMMMEGCMGDGHPWRRASLQEALANHPPLARTRCASFWAFGGGPCGTNDSSCTGARHRGLPAGGPEEPQEVWIPLNA